MSAAVAATVRERAHARAVDGAVETALIRLRIAPLTRYRSSVRRDLETLIEVIALGAPAVTPAYVRAQCLMVARPLEQAADPAAVCAYVRALLLDVPSAELAERAVATRSCELLRRFLRWGPPAHRDDVKPWLTVLTVMTS
jgi:hypothetical protein